MRPSDIVKARALIAAMRARLDSLDSMLDLAAGAARVGLKAAPMRAKVAPRRKPMKAKQAAKAVRAKAPRTVARKAVRKTAKKAGRRG